MRWSSRSIIQGSPRGLAAQRPTASRTRGFSFQGSPVSLGTGGQVRPQSDRVKWQQVWEDEATLPHSRPGSRRRAAGTTGTSSKCSVPVRDAAHGARPQLHDGRRPHALPSPTRVDRPALDGLGLVRPACGRTRPSEGGHPREIVERSIVEIREQMKRLGWAIDWDREVGFTRAGLLPLDGGCSSGSSSADSRTARRRR